VARRDRLLRWAELLEHSPSALLEMRRVDERPSTGSTESGNSPAQVAHRDAVFRVQGLRGDDERELVRFFDLNREELDRIMGWSWRRQMDVAERVAHRVRNVADPAPQHRLFLLGLALSAALALLLIAIG